MKKINSVSEQITSDVSKKTNYSLDEIKDLKKQLLKNMKNNSNLQEKIDEQQLALQEMISSIVNKKILLSFLPPVR